MNEVQANNRWRIVMRSLAIWCVLIVAEMVQGVLRAIALVAIIGEFRSNQIGVFTGSAIILAIPVVLRTRQHPVSLTNSLNVT